MAVKIAPKCRGYISSRAIAGNKIPQRVQNLVIRDYAKKRNIEFLLSATEYAFDSFFHVYNSILEDLNNIDGIIFYSIDMLPQIFQQQKDLLLPFIQKSKQVHFAVENIIILNTKDLNLLRDINMARHLSSLSLDYQNHKA